MVNYTLSIQARPLPAIIENDRITLAPPRTVKLEAQRSTIVRTGVKIGECKQGGYILVSPFRDYDDDLDFEDNIFEFDYVKEIVITVINKGYQFLRIDNTENHLFTFEWVSRDVAAVIKPIVCICATVPEIIEPVVIPVEEPPVEDEPVEEEPVEEEPLVEEPPVVPVAPVVAPVVPVVPVVPVAPAAPVVAPDVTPVAPVAPVVAKPRVIRRRIIQKKRV